MSFARKFINFLLTSESSRRKDRESIKTTDVDQSQNQKEKSRRKREDTWDIPPEKSNQMIRQKTIDLDQDKLSSGGERHEQHKGTIQSYVIGLFCILRFEFCAQAVQNS